MVDVFVPLDWHAPIRDDQAEERTIKEQFLKALADNRLALADDHDSAKKKESIAEDEADFAASSKNRSNAASDHHCEKQASQERRKKICKYYKSQQPVKATTEVATT